MKDSIRCQYVIPLRIHGWLKDKAVQERRSINKQLAVELEARMVDTKQEDETCQPEKQA